MEVTILTTVLFGLLCGPISCNDQEGMFTVIGSRSVNQYGNYSVVITSQNYYHWNSPTVEVAIQSGNGIKIRPQSIELSHNRSQHLEFDMKGHPVGDNVTLTVNGKKRLLFSKTVELAIRKIFAFVQTDRHKYKPSDNVRYRALVLDETLRPLNATNVQMFIVDGGKNKVIDLSKKNFTNGIVEGNFTISDSPVLGTWHIEMILPNNVTKTKAFTVEKYNMSTFDVTIDVRSNVSFGEGQITVFLSAKRTLGGWVNGNATITAEVGDNKITKCNIPIMGNKQFVFNITELGLRKEDGDRTVTIFATFIENTSRREQNVTANVRLHALPFSMLIRMAKKFKPGLPYAIEAAVQYYDMDVPLTDNKNPVIFYVTSVKGAVSTVNESEDYLTNGNAKIEFEVPDKVDYLNVTVTYLQTRISKSNITSPILQVEPEPSPTVQGRPVPSPTLQIRSVLHKQKRPLLVLSPTWEPISEPTPHFIMIKLKTENLTLQRNVPINIRSNKIFTEFSYHVFTVQGSFIATLTTPVAPTKYYDFEFTPTANITSNIRIIVFFITGHGQMVHDSLNVEFSEFRNFVDVKIPNESEQPNDDFFIQITSTPNSFVGLMGTGCSQSAKIFNDSSHRMKGEINSDDFFIFHYVQKLTEEIRILNGGFGSFSENIYNVVNTYNGLYSDETENWTEEDKYREIFNETWLFETVHFGPSDKIKNISAKAPHTITNWTITAFSINPVTGFAETSEPATLSVSKNFYISMDLPQSTKQNEIASIKISVFNNMDSDQNATVKMFNEDSAFEFIDSDVLCSMNKNFTQIVRVNKTSEAVTVFKIRMKQTGSIKIRASVSSMSSHKSDDWIKQDLRVEPEGDFRHKHDTVFIDLINNHHGYTKKFINSIPHGHPNTVKDSKKAQATIIGAPLSIPRNLENLLKHPFGCREQNMANFALKIVVLDYLSAVNKLTDTFKTTAVEYLQLDYQNQVKYKNGDGSFNVWGKCDEFGGTWLTAHMIKSFIQAERYIYVEPSIIMHGLRFLSQQQSKDGSFEEVGKVFRKSTRNAPSNRIALTAYVLTTFMENPSYAKMHNYTNTIVKAISFLNQSLSNITDNYVLAIATYALQLTESRNQTFQSNSVTKLEQTAIRYKGTMRWSGSRSDQATSLDVEISAYALHAFLLDGRLNDAVRIAHWLVSQRNLSGGFISTLDTVVALQALQALTNVTVKINTNMNVAIRYGKYSSTRHTVQYNESPSLTLSTSVLQTDSLDASTRIFNITASGCGVGSFQISYEYNTVHDKFKKFKISVPAFSNETPFFVRFNVRSSKDNTEAVVEVKFPPGYTLNGSFLGKTNSMRNIPVCSTLDNCTSAMHCVHSHTDSATVLFRNLGTDSVQLQFNYLGKPVVNSPEGRKGKIFVYDFNNIRRQVGTHFFIPSPKR